MRVLSGPVEGGDNTTLYVRTGALLLRLSLTAASGAPAMSPETIAQEIVDRATSQSPSSSLTVMQPAAGSLLDTLPLDHAACFSVEGEGEMDVPAVIERLATDAGVSTRLQDLGWQGGVYRQFACKPPPGRVGWVDISVDRFPDAASATEAVAYFAASRADGMDLQSVPAAEIGDSSAALTGHAVNGTEYSLYMSEGPLLYAVTGVAPDSGSDPRPDVEAIATSLLASTGPVQVEEFPSAAPATSEVIPRPRRLSPPLPHCRRSCRTPSRRPRPFRHRRQRRFRRRRRCWPRFRPPLLSRRCLHHPWSCPLQYRRRSSPRPRHHPRRRRGRYPRQHRGSFTRRPLTLADSFHPGTASAGMNLIPCLPRLCVSHTRATDALRATSIVEVRGIQETMWCR